MKQSVLWYLQKENHFPSYLLGTMHVKSQKAFRRIEQIEGIIQEVDIFGAEYNLDEMHHPDHQKALRLPEERRVSEMLTSRKFEKMRSSLRKAFDLDLIHFDRLLPLLMINIIGEHILSKDFKVPLDFYLWEYAKKMEKRLVGIETLADQQEVLRLIKLKDQIKMLKEIAGNTVRYRRSILEMTRWYEEENVQKLYKKGRKSLGHYRGILLKRRNFAMASQLDKRSQEGRTFFAIGAGHLAGNDGVLRLLKKMDWKIKAI